MVRINRRDGPAVAIRMLAVFALLALAFGFHNVASVRAQAFATGDDVVVDSYSVRFRAEPGLDAAIQFVLDDGTWAVITDGPVTADDIDWYELNVDGVTGWVDGEFLVPVATEHSLLPAGTIAVVTSDSLNVRTAAGLDAEVSLVLATGDTVTVLDGPVTVDGYDWYRLDAGSVTGWSVRNYLAFAQVDPAEIAIGDDLIVNTDFLRMRDGASLDAAVLAVLSGGTVATVLDGPVQADGYPWFQVSTEFGTGWVCGEYFTTA